MYKDFIYTQSKLYKSFGPLSPNLRPERSLLNAIFFKSEYHVVFGALGTSNQIDLWKG